MYKKQYCLQEKKKQNIYQRQLSESPKLGEWHLKKMVLEVETPLHLLEPKKKLVHDLSPDLHYKLPENSFTRPNGHSNRIPCPELTRKLLSYDLFVVSKFSWHFVT